MCNSTLLRCIVLFICWDSLGTLGSRQLYILLMIIMADLAIQIIFCKSISIVSVNIERSDGVLNSTAKF